MTVIRLPADPALAAYLDAALPRPDVSPLPGAIQSLMEQAIRHGLSLDRGAVAIADAIETLTWTRRPLLETALPPSVESDLRSLFHQISLSLPMGRRAPRLDDDAIVAGCLIVYSKLQAPRTR